VWQKGEQTCSPHAAFPRPTLYGVFVFRGCLRLGSLDSSDRDYSHLLPLVESYVDDVSEVGVLYSVEQLPYCDLLRLVSWLEGSFFGKRTTFLFFLFYYRIVSCRGKQSPPRARPKACESSSVSWLSPSLWLGKSTARGLWSKANSISPYRRTATWRLCSILEGRRGVAKINNSGKCRKEKLDLYFFARLDFS
jgi:hypothetical protein